MIARGYSPLKHKILILDDGLKVILANSPSLGGG